MRISIYILTLLLTITLISCNNNRTPDEIKLYKVEELMDDYPDSALLEIKSIHNPEKKLSKKDYMWYNVLRVQARYKNYIPIKDDTIIFTARDYLISHEKDFVRKAKAYFYSGCVYLEQGDLEQTMKQYKESELLASETDNNSLMGLIQYNIGDLLSGQGLYKEAINHYRQAEQLYSQSADTLRQAYSIGAIGRLYALFGQQDKALDVLHKGLELASLTGDRKLLSILNQNISIAYMQDGNQEEAAIFLQKSSNFNNNQSNIIRYYLNLADIYLETGNNDSLAYYTNIIEDMVDSPMNLNLKSSVLQFLAFQNRLNGRYDKAFDFQQKYTEVIEEIGNMRLEQSVYDVQEKYDHERQERAFDHKLLRKQRIIIILLTLFLLACLLSVFLLRQVIKQKNKLLLLQEAIDTINKTAKDLRIRKSSGGGSKQLRDMLLWKFNVLHKSSLLKTELEDIEKLNPKKVIAKFEKIIYGKSNKSQWSSLVETIDELHPGLSNFIQTKYPQFNETQVKVCLLSYAKLPSKEIALLINQSVHTVNMARTQIRKKMNLTEPGADFRAVISQEYKNANG